MTPRVGSTYSRGTLRRPVATLIVSVGRLGDITDGCCSPESSLFELHVRLISWHGASLSRQALSKHLATLEEAGLLRIEWRWRSKYHFLEREPIRRAWKLWLGGFVHPERSEEERADENRADQRAR